MKSKPDLLIAAHDFDSEIEPFLSVCRQTCEFALYDHVNFRCTACTIDLVFM